MSSLSVGSIPRARAPAVQQPPRTAPSSALGRYPGPLGGSPMRRAAAPATSHRPSLRTRPTAASWYGGDCAIGRRAASPENRAGASAEGSSRPFGTGRANRTRAREPVQCAERHLCTGLRCHARLSLGPCRMSRCRRGATAPTAALPLTVFRRCGGGGRRGTARRRLPVRVVVSEMARLDI